MLVSYHALKKREEKGWEIQTSRARSCVIHLPIFEVQKAKLNSKGNAFAIFSLKVVSRVMTCPDPWTLYGKRYLEIEPSNTGRPGSDFGMVGSHVRVLWCTRPCYVNILWVETMARPLVPKNIVFSITGKNLNCRGKRKCLFQWLAQGRTYSLLQLRNLGWEKNSATTDNTSIFKSLTHRGNAQYVVQAWNKSSCWI